MKYLKTSLYKVGDVVTHNGEMWEATQPSMGAAPVTNSRYWKVHILTRPLAQPTDSVPEYIPNGVYKQGQICKREGLVFKALKDNANDPRSRTGCWEHIPMKPLPYIPPKPPAPEPLPPKEIIKEVLVPVVETIVVEKVIEKLVKEPVKFELDNFWVEI